MDPHLKLTLLVTKHSTIENMAQKGEKCKIEENHFNFILQWHLSEKIYNKDTLGTTQYH